MFLASSTDLRRLVAQLQHTHDVWAPQPDPGSGQVFFDRLADA